MRYLHSVALTKVGDPVHGLSEAERAFRCCVELTEYFAIQYRTAHPDKSDIDIAAELAARIGLSLLLTPHTHAALDSDQDIRDFARRYLLALI
jgi:hypothetical protein